MIPSATGSSSSYIPCERPLTTLVQAAGNDSELDPDIFDDLFQGCAFAAYVEIAHVTGGPPDSKTVRRRAIALYEQAVTERVA